MLDVDLCSSAQVIGLYGASGTGKTSILHAIAGIHTPRSGIISIDDQVWFDAQTRTNIPIQSRRTGLVFQDAQLFPHKSVMDNLLYGYRNITLSEQKFHPDEIVQLLKLEHLTKRMPAKLSGGEKQRVALGRALLYSPRLLLLDEPLSALDGAHKAEILPFFQTVIDSTDIPMLYVSHDKAEIERLTDEIYYL
ncbi:ATP-binding cassette domain-containing protein [Moraxella sp. FZLJ2107]|nr:MULTISPECIES: ATP-binding cassette domain-containing protein [unclassified Moraxella]UTO06131.1 ATP-binding cassette domain-containing protein [Moraxella sp. FZLJ2107]UTO23518.1 ATP-binding cassette domain-containing protein [Moraxella sp. FZLJ2109]